MNEDERQVYSGSTQHKQRRELHVPLSVFESVVEKQIQEAQERGEFDNLRGSGEPIALEHNRYAGDMELAYKMLKDNDFTLPWIADRNEVTEAIAVLRGKMAYQFKLIEPEVRALARVGQTAVARQRWQALLDAWEPEIERVNTQIDTVNLLVPVRNLDILQLTLDAELRRLGVTRDLPGG
jgi:hypothetical protein